MNSSSSILLTTEDETFYGGAAGGGAVIIPEEVSHLHPELEAARLVVGDDFDAAFMRELIEGIEAQRAAEIAEAVSYEPGDLVPVNLAKIEAEVWRQTRRIRVTASKWKENIAVAVYGPALDGKKALAQDGDTIIVPHKEAEVWGRAFVQAMREDLAVTWDIQTPTRKDIEAEVFDALSTMVDGDTGRLYRHIFPRKERKRLARETARRVMREDKQERRAAA